jgi:hypothetical protein
MAPSAKGGRKVVKVAPLPVRPAFKREFLDFERGIRMGGLEPHERITQIVKAGLLEQHGQDLVIDKWGRGRFWQWICWIVRANRDSKPISGGLSFASAKFFVSLEQDDRTLDAGLQIERGRLRTGRRKPGEVYAAEDWDFYRLLEGLRKGTPLAAELDRLIRVEGFTANVGGTWDASHSFSGPKWPGPAAVRRACESVPPDAWGWFQVCYPTPEKELAKMDGAEIVATILAIFDEVTPLMNLVMDKPYLKGPGRSI